MGDRTLATYSYNPGNGLSTNYTYDLLGRTKTVTYSDGLTLTYTGDGQLYRVDIDE